MKDYKYSPKPTSVFKKDLKRVKKRGYNTELLAEVIEILAIDDEVLDEKYLDHPLSGKYEGCRECHITPDWLLVYKKSDKTLFLYLMRTGTHADIFTQY